MSIRADEEPDNQSRDRKQQLDFEREVEEEIEKVTSELTSFVLEKEKEVSEKQKDVVKRIEAQLERIRKGDRRSSICTEIKERLAEEIARGFISRKTIETSCKPESKNPVKSASGRKGAERKNKAAESAAEPAAKLELGKEEAERQDAVLIRTNGTVETEPAGHESGWKSQKQEPRVQTRGEEQDEAGEPVTADNATASDPQPSPNLVKTFVGNVEFEFWLPFETLQEEMRKQFAKEGISARVWLSGVVDAASGRVLSKQVGRNNEQEEA